MNFTVDYDKELTESSKCCYSYDRTYRYLTYNPSCQPCSRWRSEGVVPSGLVFLSEAIILSSALLGVRLGHIPKIVLLYRNIDNTKIESAKAFVLSLMGQLQPELIFLPEDTAHPLGTLGARGMYSRIDLVFRVLY